jgi:hypothetical protein
MKILNKFSLKGKPSKGEETLKGSHYFIVATVGCFEGTNVFLPSLLPTKKNRLRLFLEKVEGASIRHQTNILVVFIVTPDNEQKFDKEVANYERELKDDYSDIDEYDPPYIKIQKIIYVT